MAKKQTEAVETTENATQQADQKTIAGVLMLENDVARALKALETVPYGQAKPIIDALKVIKRVNIQVTADETD